MGLAGSQEDERLDPVYWQMAQNLAFVNLPTG